MTSRYSNADYRHGVLDGRRRPAPPREVPATNDLVVEDLAGFCGAVVHCDRNGVTLEDRHGARRVFPLHPGGFLLEGEPVTLTVPPRTAAPVGPARSASGSVRAETRRARTARASRIWVEGLHDAELLERVWGHDLRVEGVVVEPLQGVDLLADALAEFDPRPHRRVGVLVDHLVPGSKESRLVAAIDSPHVLITGHPYVDIWQAVRPASLGIPAWPVIARGTEWKAGVCAELGWGEPADGWRRVLASVEGYRDLEAPLLGAVERLIDFVTEPGAS
ncbi:DUF3097 domain-containing protein [Actinoalloteichus hymeniacidonis]|uniref:DUF3097 family protein n=1 Tax=Actinoalloteichus hymeniacidonis TaxID=340345 RepID=A0AAC9HP45_9PSEU|nr:DUF3097 domain-containing protein [Actinoalloteichus hymeniacidonis]AOS62997.1 putative DUF3097 family protein [Actinoalloteichus hymeniacidonis]MBB5908968.1 hypothetical protein [Actinoalloteichus hymeniacidonis]